jgi:ABC-type Fe3+ transport system permease subunit
MELFFETYLVITLLFALLTVCIAGIYLKNRKYTFSLSALVVFLGAVLPYFLILFQKTSGSLNKNDPLKMFSDNNTLEKSLDEIKHIYITDKPLAEVVFNSFIHNIGFIILSIVIGISLGILVHKLTHRQHSLH